MRKVDAVPGLEIRQDMMGRKRLYYHGERIIVEWSGGPPERAHHARFLDARAGHGYGATEQDAVEDLIDNFTPQTSRR